MNLKRRGYLDNELNRNNIRSEQVRFLIIEMMKTDYSIEKEILIDIVEEKKLFNTLRTYMYIENNFKDIEEIKSIFYSDDEITVLEYLSAEYRKAEEEYNHVSMEDDREAELIAELDELSNEKFDELIEKIEIMKLPAYLSLPLIYDMTIEEVKAIA